MLAVELRSGLNALALDIGSEQQQRLLEYLELLARWNRRFNLTAVRDPGNMLVRHLLDSLAVLPHLPPGDCIDVGTGGGLPGIPLAIADPGRSFTLLDSNGKKTRFLTQLKAQLNLSNVSVVHARVEAFESTGAFTVVLSRAFASLGDMIDGCYQLLAPRGVFLAMKGQHPDQEIARIQSRVGELSVIPLTVPGLDEERCLVRFTLKNSNP